MKREAGFTLLEVMIAMSILAVGATSVLSIFVAAISFHTKRVEENRITEIYNFANQHARIRFENFDPSKVKEGEPRLPKAVMADFTDLAKARQSPDPLIREGAEKFAGFKYQVRFEHNQFAVEGSSVVAHITIYRLSGQADDSIFGKEFLTRTGTPIEEFWKSPSLERQKADDQGRRGAGG